MSQLARVFVLIIAIASVFACWQATASPPTPHNAHGNSRASQVSIEAGRGVSYELFQLTSPDRVVVDFFNIERRKLITRLEDPQNLVKRIRQGRYTEDVTRIVIDCVVPVNVAHQQFETKTIRGLNDPNSRYLTIALTPVSSSAANMTGPSQALTEPNGEFAKRIRAAIGQPPAHGKKVYTALGNRGKGPFALPKPRPVRFEPGSLGAIVKHPPMPRPRTPIIVLDPGHGGKDPGAISRSGLKEKDITLAAAKSVRDELHKLGRYKIILTRRTDRFLKLRQRVNIARTVGADVFVSLHADAMRKRSVRGASVYTVSEKASDAEAAALAERENKVDLIDDVDLTGETREVTNILIDLARRDTMNRSIILASKIVPELRRVTPLLSNPHRYAGFVVLKAPDVPSVLIELGFLSNPQDEKLLRSHKRRTLRAKAIARAIHRYVSDRMEARLH